MFTFLMTPTDISTPARTEEKACYVALSPAKEEKEAQAGGRSEDFRLPDGNVIRVCLSLYPLRRHTDRSCAPGKQLGAERHRAPELLFNPEIVGLEDAGVHQVVVDSINRADLDLRKSLFGNIVLSGGGTLVKGKRAFFPAPHGSSS